MVTYGTQILFYRQFSLISQILMPILRRQNIVIPHRDKKSVIFLLAKIIKFEGTSISIAAKRTKSGEKKIF